MNRAGASDVTARGTSSTWTSGESRPSMQDSEGIQFLQWCLPRLGLRWQGFRKVRKRVYKRIARRIQELGLSGLSAYRSHLDTHAGEWVILDGLCRIPISRFYRDRGVFQHLEQEVLPELGTLAVARGETELGCWSIGCASGEEPYTLAIVWRLGPGPRVPDLRLRVLATDIDPENLARARRGCYSQSSLKGLPPAYLEQAFVPTAQGWRLGEVYREAVTFAEQDVRQAAPSGPFHLVLCRNVAFTYFDEGRQRNVLRTIVDRLVPGGALVIGSGESLPDDVPGLEVWSAKSRVYRRRLPQREAMKVGDVMTKHPAVVGRLGGQTVKDVMTWGQGADVPPGRPLSHLGATPEIRKQAFSLPPPVALPLQLAFSRRKRGRHP